MASFITKIGSSGLKAGGKVAAKKMSKSMGKKAGKSLMKTGMKGFAKKGMKMGGKKAGKKMSKKLAKGAGKKASKMMKKTSKKALKKLKKKGKKMKSKEKDDKESAKSSPAPKKGKKSKTKKEKDKKKDKGKDRRKTETKDKSKSKEKSKEKGKVKGKEKDKGKDKRKDKGKDKAKDKNDKKNDKGSSKKKETKDDKKKNAIEKNSKKDTKGKGDKKEKKKNEEQETTEDTDTQFTGSLQPTHAGDKKKGPKSRTVEKITALSGQSSQSDIVKSVASTISADAFEPHRTRIQIDQSGKYKPLRSMPSLTSSATEERTDASSSDRPTSTVSGMSEVTETTETSDVSSMSQEKSRISSASSSKTSDSELPARKASLAVRSRALSGNSRRSNAWPEVGEEMPARLPSLLRRTSSIGGKSAGPADSTTQRFKNPRSVDELKKTVQKDLIASEAAKEMDDSEFNLMLFRLAKHLMMEGTIPIAGAEKTAKRKKKRRTSEWLRALSLIVNAQNEGRSRKCGHEQSRTTSCLCCCNKPVNEGRKTVDGKTKTSPPVQAVADPETADTGKDQAEVNKPPSDGDKQPKCDRKNRIPDLSSSTSTTEASSFSSSSSSYSPRRFRENTDRFCDVIRAVNNVPPSTSFPQSNHYFKPCLCEPTPSPAPVYHATKPPLTSTQPTPTFGTIEHPVTTTQSTPVNVPQLPHTQPCCCPGHDTCRHIAPCVWNNLPYLAPECGLQMPMPLCVSPMDTLFAAVTNVQVSPSIDPMALTGGVSADPSVVYYPEFYF